MEEPREFTEHYFYLFFYLRTKLSAKRPISAEPKIPVGRCKESFPCSCGYGGCLVTFEDGSTMTVMKSTSTLVGIIQYWVYGEKETHFSHYVRDYMKNIVDQWKDPAWEPTMDWQPPK